MTTPIEEVSVLIAGSGSAGLAAATWLSIYAKHFPSLHASNILILDKRPVPMTMGQADGVQCRTVEIFESFGLSEELLRESYHCLEVAFWRDEGVGRMEMRRKRTTMDTERGLSWCPHVLLNQARVNGLLIGKMGRESGLGVSYGWDVKDVRMEEGGEWVRVRAERSSDGEGWKSGDTKEWRARYVLACDGAHSNVRRSLGVKMVGDSSDAVWGVMDVYPVTDFPDIRKKCTIHSKDAAFIIIPREDDLVRFYIEMPPSTKAKDVSKEDLHQVAKKMFGQYKLEIADTYWWSAYSIGQRLAERFSEGNRIFLTGDASHTHSPKAGQGMNVSLQDGYNIGWKLGMVLSGQADESLLKTYDVERGEVAKDLIEFDKRWTKTFSPRHAKDVKGAEDPEFFAKEFIKTGRYTAGLTAKYNDTALTDAKGSVNSGEVGRVVVGMRCPSAQVVRFCDANAMQLARAMRSDGRWRIVIFAGDITHKEKEQRLNEVSDDQMEPR
jgi:phenol 2-monooxygenase (NADPH)